MKIAVIGQGYVGLPLALAAAKAGHTVTGIDSNIERVTALNAGVSPIEDISNNELKMQLDSKNYSANINFNEINECEIVIVCVPTPLNENHQPDLSYLEKSVSNISKYIKDKAVVIIESTVAPGTTRSIVANLLNSSGKKYSLAYSPERIDPANLKWNVVNTPKLVAGVDPESAKMASDFYKTFVDSVLTYQSIEVVETAKLLENTFRLVNISFINEIAEFCHRLKIDVREVISAAASKPYGFMPFYPSVGVGGHCIPVDPNYLTHKADEIGAPLQITKLAFEINQNLPSNFKDLIENRIGNLRNKRILVIGIAYKPNVSDIRESAAIELIKQLRKSGAEVSWHDELVKNWNGETSTELSNDWELIVLANVHSGTDLEGLDPAKILNTKGGY